MYKFKAYINGCFLDKKEKVAIISPLDNSIAGQVPALKKADINNAFHAARSAFASWSQVEHKVREDYLISFSEKLLENIDKLAQIMHMEIGKDISEAKSEINRSVEYIQKTIDAWKNIEFKKEVVNNKVSFQYLIPLGIVLAISPFNYPVNLLISKIAPAILSGNTVVYKSATNGSLTGGFIISLFDQISIPHGVINYVTGRGRDIGDILTSHPEIDMISFTGGVSVGKRISDHVKMKPLVLELGGNDAAYVRYDADLDVAAEEIVNGAFGYSGQRCTAIKRVIVDKRISEDLERKIVHKAKQLKLAPLIDQASVRYVKSIYDEAKDRKDKFLLDGYFKENYVSPIIIKTDFRSMSWKDEAFGPILPIVEVSNDKLAIELMNNTNFGLQNSIFTKDKNWVFDNVKKVQSGTVNINSRSSRGPDEFPFSGIKDSGFGTQGIKNALLSMTRVLNLVDNKKNDG